MKYEHETIYDINDINFSSMNLNSNVDSDKHEDNDSNNENEEDEYGRESLKSRRPTFCGTAEYVSPEMLFGEEVEFEADYWALGCIIYKLITGSSPFKEKSQHNK